MARQQRQKWTLDLRRLRADDSRCLACDGHGPCAASARRDVDADVTLSGLGASLGVVEHLLSLAVLVHCYRHHFLLTAPRTAHHHAAVLHNLPLTSSIGDRVHKNQSDLQCRKKNSMTSYKNELRLIVTFR